MAARSRSTILSRFPIVLAVLASLALGACDQGAPTPTPLPTSALPVPATAPALATPTVAPATVAPATAAPASATSTSIVLPPTPTSAAGPQPTIAGDGDIHTDKLYHDSRDPQFRSPGGAVPAGTQVTLRLKTAPGDLTSAIVRIWNTRTQTETLVPMSPIAPDMWEAKIDTPAQGAALFYRFIASDGAARAFYQDDQNLDGGAGAGQGYVADADDYTLVAYDPDFKTPEWLRDGVVYQIFPDRFNNGDPANDRPAGTFFYGGTTVGRAWGDAPKGSNDFFGGDLKGITQKLDYLKSLGVTVIYLNPIFMSPSNHRYDTTDYTQIDPALGTIDDFKELVSKARDNGIKILLDGVFNHSSSDSIYFDKYSRYPNEGAYESQQSPYFGWYTFQSWPKKYNDWSNVDSLPAFTENSSVISFLFNGPNSIVRTWTRTGIGGWRLDAADQKSYDYWRDLRQVVKQENPDDVIIGEYWHNSAPWLAGDQWDGTMNYRFRDAVMGWLTNPIRPVETMARQLDSIREDYPPQALAASMNLIDSHDTKRALTDAGGDKNILRLLAVMQFTWPGLPTIYYGDEAGLEGGNDPDDRRTYPWGSEDTSLIDFYKMLGTLRHQTSALSTGDYIDLGYDNQKDVYAYARKDNNGLAVIALNRNTQEQEFDLPMKNVAPDGTVLTDHLNSGVSYTVQGGILKVKLGPKWGVLLTGK